MELLVDLVKLLRCNFVIFIEGISQPLVIVTNIENGDILQIFALVISLNTHKVIAFCEYIEIPDIFHGIGAFDHVGLSQLHYALI